MKKLVLSSVQTILMIILAVVFSRAQTPVLNHGNIKPLIVTTDEMLLYSQLGIPSDEPALASQEFPDFPEFSCQGADDFTVPPGPQWMISKIFVQGTYSVDPPGGPADIVILSFYMSEGAIPGPPMYEFMGIPAISSPEGNLEINLPAPVSLIPGSYWIAVQPMMPSVPFGQWYWAKQEAPTAGSGLCWRNPGGGFGIPGTNYWAPGQIIPWPTGPISDLNFGFAIYGTSEMPEIPFIESLNEDLTHYGESVRVYGSNFGNDLALGSIIIDGIQFPAEVTNWTSSRVYFNCPALPPGPHTIQIMNDIGLISNILTFETYIPNEVYFLSPDENERIMSDVVTISVAPPILSDFVDHVDFYATPDGSPDRIYLGTDSDGSSKSASTYFPQGHGNGWSLDWTIPSLTDQNFTIEVNVFDKTGTIYFGSRPFSFDEPPFKVIKLSEISKLIGGLTPLDDSIVVDLEIDEELINDIVAGARPLGGFAFQRELTPMDQDTITDATDIHGHDMTGSMCGPTAATICLDYLKRNSKGSGISDMSGTAKSIAGKAGTTSESGTRDDNLAKAIQETPNASNGIPPVTTQRYSQNQDPYGQVPGNLRDENDVIMLINQQIANPDGTIDTVGHYVTISSHHSEISYQQLSVPNGEWRGCVAVKKEYIDFMDPATGQTEYKQVEWYNNPVTIKDYDIAPPGNKQGSSWVAGTIIVKKKNKSISANKEYVWSTSITPNGSGNYRINIPCSELPEGVFELEISANSAKETEATEKAIIVNGPADPFAGFEPDIKYGSAPLTVAFNNISQPSGQLISWEWDFGDGITSADQNPVHIYETPGIWDVKLIVSDGVKTDTAFRSGLIHVVPGQTQTINIPAGWSGFSGSVMPNNPALESVMQPIINELEILQTLTQMYWPAEGINTVGNFNPEQGYIIKLNEDATLSLQGIQVTDLTLDLEAGWNIIPVMVPCLVSPEQLFSSISDALIICKEIAGNGIIWPALNIETITEFTPGKAYFIKLSQPATFVFPDCGINLK